MLVRPPGERQSEWVDLWEAYVSMEVVGHEGGGGQLLFKGCAFACLRTLGPW